MRGALQHGVAAAAGAVAGAGIVVLVGRAGDPLPPPADTATRAVDLVSHPAIAGPSFAERLTALEERLARLENVPATAASDTTRIPVESAADTGLAVRVEALAREVAELRDGVAPYLWQDPWRGENSVQARESLELVLGRIETDVTGSLVRIPLLQRLLEGWPTHERAAAWLNQLTLAYEAVLQKQKALPAVERAAARMNLGPVEFDKCRLAAAWHDADVIAIAHRLTVTASDPDDRLWARTRLIDSLVNTGMRDDAIAEIDRMLAELPFDRAVDRDRFERRRAELLRR